METIDLSLEENDESSHPRRRPSSPHDTKATAIVIDSDDDNDDDNDDDDAPLALRRIARVSMSPTATICVTTTTTANARRGRRRERRRPPLAAAKSEGGGGRGTSSTMTTTREEGGDGDGGDGAADFEEEHQFWLPPLLNGEYDVIIPVTPIGLMLNVGEQNGCVAFLGYRQHPDGSKGPAEINNLIRKIGDIIIAVNGHSTAKKTFKEIIPMLNQRSTYAYLRLVHRKRMTDGGLTTSCSRLGRHRRGRRREARRPPLAATKSEGGGGSGTTLIMPKAEEVGGGGDLEEEAGEITYARYRPARSGYGRDHPDPVVENSTLGAVEPPDVSSYDLAVPSSVIVEGRLSNLQLEAIVHGCRRHDSDLPSGTSSTTKPVRAGFLLGDGAGMGKGRTLAGFVAENVARGRSRHVWISVSSDLHEDAKRDLRDLGLDSYADETCFNLGKLPYDGDLSETCPQGVMFVTYQTLVSKNREGRTRLDQLIEWCGGEDFEGLVLFDECHKAKTIELDADGNPKTEGQGIHKRDKSSQTAIKVVQLQQALPRARVVYCSATSVSHPRNLAFMSRLGLWGHGTEHPSGFNQFLLGLKRLGTGSMELHAMHLKSIGALCARTLSYENCEFELVDGVSNGRIRRVYNRATELWTDLHAQLADRCTKINKRVEMDAKVAKWTSEMGEEGVLGEDMRYHLDLHRDSDTESDDEEDNNARQSEERRLRRVYRDRQSKFLKGLFWSAHQRFFRSLCIASKVDRAISLAREALKDGHCCVIGLQSTGEARSKGAALAAGFNDESGGQFEDFVCAPNEDLKRIILMMLPLPPKPKGVIAPVFLNPVKDISVNEDITEVEDMPSEESQGKRRSSRDRHAKAKKRKGSGRERIPWDKISIDLDVTSVENERLVNYRKAVDNVMQYMEAVNDLDLPANPLDRLLNELGGPDKVAELTGRKIRQIQRFDESKGRMIVTYEKRKGIGRLDQINIEERNNFQSGKKLVAILSEAASTGISLQSDKRVANTRRRVHITLELPWSADKAIQQLGRTHRSNQVSGPKYKVLLSDVGGEKRFASAVAKRLALLGALTQGDRRATGQSNALGLGEFDCDNRFGQKALNQMLDSIWKCERSPLTEAPDSLGFEALRLIDSHLTTIMDEDGDWRMNMAPYDDDTKAQQTFYEMMESLLLGPCVKLTETRVEAIKGGRSVAMYCDSLENGTELKESIKPKIDEEVKAAKDEGLNFHVLCYIWLFEVGITKETSKPGKYRPPIGVSKFLNRSLGMNLLRQKLLTEHFMKFLEKEISLAKRAGEYDQGIKTISGHSVAIHKPRSFCFRGIEAKDERVLVYKVAVDRGMDSKNALTLYEDAKAFDIDSNDDGQRIVSGFYVDRRRDIYKEVPKIFLIINQGKSSSKCVVVRPNEGKKIYTKVYVWDRLIHDAHGTCQLSRCTDISGAVDNWNLEFNLADRPSFETYQRYCYGRHDESIVFSGSIVPILNKILVSASFGQFSEDNENLTMPSIVRVERSDKPQQSIALELNAEPQQTEKRNESAEDVGGSSPAVGDKVARVFGSNIFRGIIIAEVDQSGLYTTRFPDGRCIKMNIGEVEEAKELVESETKKLLEENLPSCAANTATQQTARRPTMAVGEEKETEEYERYFEEEHSGEVPSVLVGLQFPKRTMDWYSQIVKTHIPIPLWQFVLRKLSEKLLEEGAASSRDLLNLENAEGSSG